MIVTPTIKDYLLKNNLDKVYDAIRDNTIEEMITMNSSLAMLKNSGLISEEEALAVSNDKPELEKIFRGVYVGTKGLYE